MPKSENFLKQREQILTKYMKELHISWWNVENLFDYKTAERSDKLNRTIGKELKGWNQTVLNKKLQQLAKIIVHLNNGKGPDILGICEAENRIVLEKLLDRITLKRRYKIAHVDSKDRRGIDIAFIYDEKLFSKKEVFSHYIVKRTATRELVQVNLEIKQNKQPLVLIGNHWPARIGGKADSEPYRIIAGETLAYFHKRIIDEMGKDTPIIAMGDFNDEPFDRSLMEHALSVNNVSKVQRARTPKFYNLMWSLLAKGRGTHYYGSDISILDQMMVSKALLDKKTGLSIKLDSIKIEDDSSMAYRGKPRRFGRPSKKYNPDGYSDHFPISAILEWNET